MENNAEIYQSIAELLKVIAHPVRLCILNGLLNKEECNVTYMQSCLNTPQSTISQHLQKLKAAGIIEGRRNGLEIYYRIKNRKIAEFIRSICEDKND